MKNHSIPVAARHSILDTGDLKNQLLPLYQLPSVLSCDFWFFGLNHTYKIRTAEGDFALRIYVKDWRTEEEVEFEVELLRYLDAHGGMVAPPVPRQDGGFLTLLAAPEGTRIAIVTEWVEGKYPAFEEEQEAVEFGKAVAKFHEHARGFEAKSTIRRHDLNELLYRPLELLVGHFRPADADFLRQHVQTLADRVSEVADQLEMGHCHGDFFGPNGHLRDGHFQFFDMDCCGHGYLIADLASFKASLLIRLNKMEIWPKFLAGYQSVRSLSETELQTIDIFMAIFFVGRDSRGVTQYNAGYVGKELFNENNYKLALGLHRKMAAAYAEE